MQHGRITLTRYTIEAEHKHPGASGEFSGLLNSLATAIKIISNQVNKGALVGALGNAGGDEGGAVNVQGEVQKQLDVLSNEVMLHENQWAGSRQAGMASEEMEEVYLGCPPTASAASTCWSSIRSTAVPTSTST
jgi:fructose-1,6-bisphosphatase I